MAKKDGLLLDECRKCKLSQRASAADCRTPYLHDELRAFLLVADNFALAQAITVFEWLKMDVGPKFVLYIDRVAVKRPFVEMENAGIINSQKVVATSASLTRMRRVVEIVSTVRHKVAVTLQAVGHGCTVIARALRVLIRIKTTRVEAVLGGPVSVARKAYRALTSVILGKASFIQSIDDIASTHDYLQVG